MTDSEKKEDELAGTEQPFVQHLYELRDRLLYALYGIGVVFVALLVLVGPSHLYDYLALPLVKSLPEGSRMIAVGVVSPFLVPIKVTVMAAIGLSLPWILYQVWAFVAPGLYKHEKKLVLPLVAASTLLFYMGAAFCYFFVFYVYLLLFLLSDTRKPEQRKRCVHTLRLLLLMLCTLSLLYASSY